MREIKFRAKRLDNGEWAYGYGVIIADDFCVLDKRDELYIQRPYTFRNNTHWFELCGIMCDTNTLSQFTGLHDKNNREIYEGDIVKRERKSLRVRGFPEKTYSEVGYICFKQNDGRYVMVTSNSEYSLCEPYDVQMEVICNIHDNPELLKSL